MSSIRPRTSSYAAPFHRPLAAPGAPRADVGARRGRRAGHRQPLRRAATLRGPRERLSLVFLDVDMPRLNGIDACRRLREDDSTGDPTIVMLTVAHGDSVEADAEEAGADLFLTKPF